MSGEPTLRYVVERRWKKPPPAPYTNEWEVTCSFYDAAFAREAARDDADDNPAWEYRMRDTQGGRTMIMSNHQVWVHVIQTGLPFARKPMTFQSPSIPKMRESIVRYRLTDTVYNLMVERVLTASDLWPDHVVMAPTLPYTEFSPLFYLNQEKTIGDKPIAFMLRRKGCLFLVNTEGFNYCRYVMQIKEGE